MGGEYQGGGDVPKARQAILTPATRLTADGLMAGGRVIVWSQERTEFAGLIVARGGNGFVEVSSKDALAFAGSVTADRLLLDPKNITVSDAGSYPSFSLSDPNPGAGNSYATSITVLPNGNVVVVNTTDDAGGSNAGAAYLFDGASGALISTLTGSTANDEIGGNTPVVLTNGNYLLRSPSWDNGAATNAGAVTWRSATAGRTGAISASNSLVGTTASDLLGNYGLVVGDSNFLTIVPTWDDITGGTTITDAGAITWINGATGLTGPIIRSNSMVGTHNGDKIGSSITVLSNGNYVVASRDWGNGTATKVGAVTWGNGNSAITGNISASNSLLDDLNWLNQNPLRRVDLVYERSQEPGRSDIVLRVQDRLPFRAFAGYENTGTETTEQGRTFVGFNWGNALGLDHQLSYQFTSSPGFWNNPTEKPRSASHSGSYIIPLPWRHTLTLFGSYSESVPEIDDRFHQIGRSAQASARYDVPLPGVEKITHDLIAGFDWKRSNNDLEFGGVSVSSTAADVAQWMVGYSASRPDGWGALRPAPTCSSAPAASTATTPPPRSRPSGPTPIPAMSMGG